MDEETTGRESDGAEKPEEAPRPASARTRAAGPLRWRNVLVELLVVVTGILIALWLDDWNQARLEAEAREGAVAALRRDLSADTAAIRQTIERQTAEIRRMERLLGVAAGGPWSDSIPLAVEVSRLGFHQLLTTDDTYRDLLSTGRLADWIPAGVRSRLRLYAFLTGTGDGIETYERWAARLRSGLPEPLWRLGLGSFRSEIGEGEHEAALRGSEAVMRDFLASPGTRAALRDLRASTEEAVGNLEFGLTLARQMVADLEKTGGG